MTTPGRMKILLVEDDPGDVFLLREFLTELPFEVQLDVAENGLQAMAYLRHEPPFAEAPLPDLILLDLNMPKMDGEELLRRMAANDALRRIPVVVVSTDRTASRIHQMLALGATGYVSKPFTPEMMREELERILSTVPETGVANGTE